jgi:hypothetical protein
MKTEYSITICLSRKNLKNGRIKPAAGFVTKITNYVEGIENDLKHYRNE